jgi:hypothetical protein
MSGFERIASVLTGRPGRPTMSETTLSYPKAVA